MTTDPTPARPAGRPMTTPEVIAMVTISYEAADHARAELDNLLASDQLWNPVFAAKLRRHADEIRAACDEVRKARPRTTPQAAAEVHPRSASPRSAPEGIDDREALIEVVRVVTSAWWTPSALVDATLAAGFKRTGQSQGRGSGEDEDMDRIGVKA